MFIDETGASIKMARLGAELLAASVAGQPCRWILEDHDFRRRFVPRRHDGTDGSGRPDERPGFLAYVEQVLALTLKLGDTVVTDNLHTHKVAGVPS